MYGRGWIKMGAGASFFFKNAGPVLKWFILLISISLNNIFIEYSVMITRLQKLSQMQISFFCSQVFSTHSKVDVAMVKVGVQWWKDTDHCS